MTGGTADPNGPTGPTGHPFYDALGRLAAYAHAADDVITGSVTATDVADAAHGPSSATRRGYHIERDGVPLTLSATPGEARFRVSYTFSFVDVFVEYVTEETTELFDSDIDPQEYTEPELRREVAAQTLKTIDDDSLATAVAYARSELGDEMRSRGDLLSVTVDEETYFDGVEVYDYLYPYERGTGVTDYDRLVGHVASEGSALARTVTEPIEFLTTERSDPLPSPAFQ